MILIVLTYVPVASLCQRISYFIDDLIYKFCNVYLSIFTLRKGLSRPIVFGIYSRQVLDSTTELIHTHSSCQPNTT